MQHQRTQHMLGYQNITPGQMVVLPGFPQVLPACAFQQLPPWHQVISVPGSHYLLYQGSGIVVPAQHIPQDMLQGQMQFLVPRQMVPCGIAYGSGSVVPRGAGRLMPQEVITEKTTNVLPPAPRSLVPRAQQAPDQSKPSPKKAPRQQPSKKTPRLQPSKKTPRLQPSKKAGFQKQLQKHQEAVLNPDSKTPFRSFNDALQRLLPYHLYQDTSDEDSRQVDEEFEEVSAQLLQRKQVLLDKYRHLLLEESQRVSSSAEVVMIEHMFIEEEKTALELDKQLAKENPGKYISSLSHSSSVTPVSVSSAVPAPKIQKVPPAQTAPPINTNRVEIKCSRSSLLVTLTKASPSWDEEEPLRSKTPTNTLEEYGQIPLKMKIRREAGIYQMVQNTILDPVHQPLPPAKCRKRETF